MLQHHRCTITLKTKHKPRLSVPYKVICNSKSNSTYIATVRQFRITVHGHTLAEIEQAIRKAVEHYLYFNGQAMQKQ